MLKRFLTIKGSSHFQHPFDGVMLSPSLSENFSNPPRPQPFKGLLIFPDGKRQEVHIRTVECHYSGRPGGLPAWATNCFIMDVKIIPEGTEVWWDDAE